MLKVPPCSMKWANEVTNSKLPSDTLMVTSNTEPENRLFVGCRLPATKTPGLVYDGDCVVPFGAMGAISPSESTFDVLTGQGFDWVTITKAGPVPAKAVLMGQENGKNVYMARHEADSWSYVGKFVEGDDYYY